MAWTSRRLVVISFFSLILVPVALFGVDAEHPLYTKDPFPQTLSRQTPRAFVQWFNTRLGFRFTAMRIGAWTQWGVLRRSTSPWVVVGNDGWVFLSDIGDSRPQKITDFRGVERIDPKTLAQIERNLIGQKNDLARCGIPFVVAIGPNKQSIYGEHLVSGRRDVETRLTDMLAKLNDEARAVIVDPRADLLRYKAAHPDLLLYHKTGSHWSDLGAYFAYKGIIDRLKLTNAVFASDRAELSTFDIVPVVTRGDNMDQNVVFARELFVDLDVQLKERALPAPITEKDLGDRTVEFTNPNGKGRLVFVGDSFGVKLVPLLARHFATVIYLRGSWLRGDVIADHRPDVVVLERVERNVLEFAYSPVRLDAICPDASTKAGS